MPSPHVHVPFNRIYEYLDFIKARRLNLEIYFSSAVLDTVSDDEIRGLDNKLDYHPSLSFHAPFMDLSPGAVDSGVRDVTVRRFSHILDIAELMKPQAVVFHSGYEKWKYALSTDLWIEKSLLTWAPLNTRASGAGIKIAIENIFEDEPSNLRLLMEAMSSKNFGICFDTGHFNLFSKAPLEEWLDALNPYIIELHLHDNDRSSDQHISMGEGTFDFNRFFDLLKNRDCIHTLEAHTPDNVIRSMEYLRKTAPYPTDI